MTRERLDVDAIILGNKSIDDYSEGGFIDVPTSKQSPHPSQYFRELFLTRANAKGIENKKVAECLDISEKHFYMFLKGKVSVTMSFAQKLAVATGLNYEFWLRTQYHYDKANNIYKNNAKPIFS
ncbi:MAG: hypothetical protein GJ680_21205 [Alteromonadaceae bacterium]|nr:hypothetical protein [Alteromonadaceae bacterium]